MPPTRGHDLKPLAIHGGHAAGTCGMPPTRGHDLKPHPGIIHLIVGNDAPHTGARLETFRELYQYAAMVDAPHTGARLETSSYVPAWQRALMPPTRGHDLKLHTTRQLHPMQ